jgi:hypothetical protein
MAESLVSCESVTNTRQFLRTSTILFLNKIDVLKSKLPKICPYALAMLIFLLNLPVVIRYHLKSTFPSTQRDHTSARRPSTFYAGELGAVKCLPAVPSSIMCRKVRAEWWSSPLQFNANDRYNQHQTGLRRCQGDDITERAEGLWYPMGRMVGIILCHLFLCLSLSSPRILEFWF